MIRNRRSKLLRWIRWIGLSLILLPIVFLLVLRMSGSMKMRKSNEDVLLSLKGKFERKEIKALQVDGRHISYLVTSRSKKANAIVFVHGSPGSLDAYLEYMDNDTLLENADLIAYDRPGFGLSDFGRSEPSLKQQAKILSTLIEELGYSGYWLVGHSYGAPVIVQTTIDRPEKIRGLCIIAGSVNYEQEPPIYWRKWIDLPLVREIFPISLKVSNQELMTLKEDLKYMENFWTKITVPVSLIHGTKDVLVPFENLNLARVKLVNADTVRTLIFEDENHFILWTQKDQIVKEIDALMKNEQ